MYTHAIAWQVSFCRLSMFVNTCHRLRLKQACHRCFYRGLCHSLVTWPMFTCLSQTMSRDAGCNTWASATAALCVYLPKHLSEGFLWDQTLCYSRPLSADVQTTCLTIRLPLLAWKLLQSGCHKVFRWECVCVCVGVWVTRVCVWVSPLLLAGDPVVFVHVPHTYRGKSSWTTHTENTDVARWQLFRLIFLYCNFISIFSQLK